MQDVVFESTGTMSQALFARWIDEHARWDPNHYELLNGRIVMTPPAGHPHGSVENRAQYVVTRFVRERGLGEVFGSSQGFELPSGDTVEPDTAFVSAGRWSAGPAPEEGKFLRVVPDLVVEVLSPGTASRDRGEKKGAYERNGVLEYWIVDARAREVTVFHLRDGRWDAGDVWDRNGRFESRILPGLVVSVADLFP